MFETSLVHVRPGGARRRAGLLTTSIIAHTAVIFGSVAVSLASVDFPRVAPDEYRAAPSFAAVPPPLGNPNGGGRAQQPPASRPQTPPPLPTEPTAPNTVPDETTPADAPSTGGNDAGGSDAPGLEPGPRGVPWGDPNSVATDLDLPPVVPQTPAVEDRIYQAHEVKAPVILRRVEPRYPQSMIRVGMSATVVVRCVIDKQGNVRNPQVLVSSMPPFNAAVLDAVEQWKFTPGTLRGQPVDTYLELKVTFAVRR